MKTIAQIKRKAKNLKKKLMDKEVYENFGQNEVRELEEFADVWNIPYLERLKALDIIKDFDDWCMIIWENKKNVKKGRV